MGRDKMNSKRVFWVARNGADGKLHIFKQKPQRALFGSKFWYIYSAFGNFMNIDDVEFPEFKDLKWEDEPIAVEIKILKDNKKNIERWIKSKISALTSKVRH